MGSNVGMTATRDRISAYADAAVEFFRRNKGQPYSTTGFRIRNMYVELSIRIVKGEPGFYLGAIENYGAHRCGTASKMLATILAMADAVGAPVFLTPEPYGKRQGLDLDALSAWYERYGFQPHGTMWITNVLEERIEKPLWRRAPV